MTITSGPSADTARRVLVVTAHPDDVDFAASATIARWTAHGVHVTYLVCTAGDAGGFDETPRTEMAALRQAEQRAAAAAVGVTEVRFLGYPDGRVVESLELRRDITRVIRRVRPDRVVTHSPEIDWRRIAVAHPDHRAVGAAAVASVYPDARNPFAHPELDRDGLEPWTVRELWLVGSPAERINHAVDVTDTFDRKAAALAAHRSQTAHLPELVEELRAVMAEAAAELLPASASPGGPRLAETYQVVDTA
ncbi:LmbE family N-acetylglucosaminyl deacetylase [Actinoalloteichus hoggarensis]|uniref:PIG-L deacetylase family protein n=1 Tax=Actinoalloteichus hoggarensis TaxID=1470176 RepID=UPI0017BF50AA|nr:PIG-L deacetylase family protein [Actinoalloteichus hoggarensis]MBB5924132.1 LmbE family N-acetylglucosaminyl deacetylase [Actinoalloteichus hoggarensis]